MLSGNSSPLITPTSCTPPPSLRESRTSEVSRLSRTSNVTLELIGGRSQRPKDAVIVLTPLRHRRNSDPAITAPGTLTRSLSARTMNHLERGIKEVDKTRPESEKLGQWLSTGLCGNNITSSALYVVAICSVPAGKYAPVALACIAVLLYLFRGIYEEVVMALPVNGGTYNLLLNTTSKNKASIAACLTMLSYVTTAVISANSAMRYIHSVCEPGPCAVFADTSEASVVVATLLTISVAAVLNLFGITESALVAFLIFFVHMLTMGLLIIFSAVKAMTDMPPAPNVTGLELPPDLLIFAYNWQYTEPRSGSVGSAIFFGYSSALLGISGFESSSNFVENQKDGVFPKTLRNMWLAVSIINPSIAILSQCLLPMSEIEQQAQDGALLSEMGSVAAGTWLKYLVIADAMLVLVGAVITAFVGYIGLVHRMALDRCLPQALLQVNKLRRTRHWVILSFWLMTSLLVILTWGELETVAGVYTICFLSVMWCFSTGNVLLKLRRSTLPTHSRASWSVVLFAGGCIFAGIVGNLINRPGSLPALVLFGAIFILPVQLMLNRVQLLQVVAIATRVPPEAAALPSSCSCRLRPPSGLVTRVHEWAITAKRRVADKPIVYFVKRDNPRMLTKVVRYVLTNEQRRWIKFVRVVPSAAEVPAEVPGAYRFLKEAYDELTIELVVCVGVFGPRLVKTLSAQLHVPLTFMFMGSFDLSLGHTFMAMGGLRIITAAETSNDESVHGASTTSTTTSMTARTEPAEMGEAESTEGGLLRIGVPVPAPSAAPAPI